MRHLALLTAGNLLPLVFVATGSLDLPLLLVCYGVEAVLLPRDPDLTTLQNLQLRAATLVVAGILLARAFGSLEWSWTTLLVVVATVALTLLPGRPAGGLGAVLWRICLLLVGGVVALSYAEDLAVLRAAGWRPEPVGSLVSTPFAHAFNELVAALGLAPLAAAAVVFVLFKTVNEALWAARRGLSPATPAPR